MTRLPRTRRGRLLLAAAAAGSLAAIVLLLLAGPLFSWVVRQRLDDRASDIRHLSVTSPLSSWVGGEPMRLSADIGQLTLGGGGRRRGGAADRFEDIAIDADKLELGKLSLSGAKVRTHGDQAHLIGTLTSGPIVPGIGQLKPAASGDGELLFVAPSGSPVDAIAVSASDGDLQSVVVGGFADGRPVGAFSGRTGPWNVDSLKATLQGSGVQVDLRLSKQS